MSFELMESFGLTANPRLASESLFLSSQTCAEAELGTVSPKHRLQRRWTETFTLTDSALSEMSPGLQLY